MNWAALIEDGILTDLYKRGFLSPKIFGYIELNQRYDAYRQQGFGKCKAIEMTSDKFDKSIMTVRRAISACE